MCPRLSLVGSEMCIRDSLFCLGTASAQQKFSVASPDGKLKLVLDIAPEKVAYSVKYGKQQLLEDSRLGFEFDSGEFGAGLKAGKVQRRKIDEAYELVVGKVRRARNYCNEMTVPLVERNGKERTVNLVVSCLLYTSPSPRD